MRVEELPFAAHIEHAYTPRETGSHGGGNHIIVDEAVTIGRIHREPRSTLCRKDRYSFWGLTQGGEKHTPNCKRCIEIAKRVLPDPQPEQCGGSGEER